MSDALTPLAYRIPAACRISGVGRTKLYQLISEKVLDARKIGDATVIMADSLHQFVRNAPKADIRMAPRLKRAA